MPPKHYQAVRIMNLLKRKNNTIFLQLKPVKKKKKKVLCRRKHLGDKYS